MGMKGVDLALKERPQIIIMDIGTELNGIDATLSHPKRVAGAKIVILIVSSLDSNEKIYPALRCRCKGYI